METFRCKPMVAVANLFRIFDVEGNPLKNPFIITLLASNGKCNVQYEYCSLCRVQWNDNHKMTIIVSYIFTICNEGGVIKRHWCPTLWWTSDGILHEHARYRCFTIPNFLRFNIQVFLLCLICYSWGKAEVGFQALWRGLQWNDWPRGDDSHLWETLQVLF